MGTKTTHLFLGEPDDCPLPDAVNLEAEPQAPLGHLHERLLLQPVDVALAV